MSSAARQPVTGKQHALLIVLCLIGSALILYFLKTRPINARLSAARVQMDAFRRQLSFLESQLATRQAMDLPTMRTSVEEARVQLRTLQLSGERSGKPFINSKSKPEVEAFQALISRAATDHRLSIQKHAAVTATSSAMADLVVRDLEIRGRFTDLANFVETLGGLKHRVVILSLELNLEAETPGLLRAVLRYSV